MYFALLCVMKKAETLDTGEIFCCATHLLLQITYGLCLADKVQGNSWWNLRC